MPEPTDIMMRHSRPLSPPTAVVTPARTNSRGTLNFSSYSPTVTSGSGQQKLNVITRVVIEGKAKQGEDGASIKMYFKISLPLDAVAQGSTIPLFPEENVKILSSQVHPLDNSSVPYNFSSTVSPLLHNAARALNLPSRSSESFNSVFNLSNSHINGSTTSSNRSSNSSINPETIPPIDAHYTGHILVSGYHISYVLPKLFPTRAMDHEAEHYSRPSARARRPSAGERSNAQFIAAIDLWVPYLSRPPRSPYLLSIPTPRCLQNHVKLRIFPPANTSNSYASLSSIDDDNNSWDLSSDPHVTRNSSNRPSRSNSYTHFADDESSDSSMAGFSEGCGIQGTFPSAERIRIRWAKPSKSMNLPEGGRDGRRRVGVKHVKGEMCCTIRGKVKASEETQADGLIMSVAYTGTCTGVWFPGVATLLGMDIGLEAKGSDISWADGHPSQWEVSGGIGYTGFDIGPKTSFPTQPNFRISSFDSSDNKSTPVPVATNEATTLRPNPQSSRTSSTSSTTSLLRAPLPAQTVADYSFEGSTSTLASNASTSSPISTLSSIASLSVSNPSIPHASDLRPPGAPTTLHLNINDLIPPAKNSFTFTIAGIVVITPRSGLSRIIRRSASRNPSPVRDAEGDTDAVMLPCFTILAADSESTSTVVRNEVDSFNAVVEVYNPTGDIYRDAQAKKTVLQKGGFTRCGEAGGRIILKSHDAPFPPSRSRTPVTSQASNSLGRPVQSSQLFQDGHLLIPSILATITPLLQIGVILPKAYGVRLCLTAPVSGWLEFGFAHRSESIDPIIGRNSQPPELHLACATVDGIPAQVETTVVAKTEASSYGVAFEQLSGRDWVSWVKVHIGSLGSGNVVVDYVVHDEYQTVNSKKGKGRENDGVIDILLPTFSMPIGKLDIVVDVLLGFNIVPLRSNITHQQATHHGHRFLQYSLEEYFYPHLSLAISQCPTEAATLVKLKWYFIVTWLLLLVLILALFRVSFEASVVGRSTASHAIHTEIQWKEIPTSTITSTIYTSTGTRWWFGDASADLTSSTRLPSQSISETAPPSTTQFRIPEDQDINRPTRSILTTKTPVTSLEHDLQPFQELFSFSWPSQDFTAVKATYQNVVRTFGIFWRYLRKAYHYPLDIP